MRIEMGEKSAAGFSRAIVAKLELGRIRAGGESLEPPAHTRSELGRITEANAVTGMARRYQHERRARGRIEIDREHGTFGFTQLSVRKDLARPERKPTVDELDLTHRQPTRVGELEQQRMRIR